MAGSDGVSKWAPLASAAKRVQEIKALRAASATDDLGSSPDSGSEGVCG